MKKYLLIVKSKRLITYEVYTSYIEMLQEIDLMRCNISEKFSCKFYRIDNLSKDKMFKIKQTLSNYLFDHIEVSYGK